MAAYLVDSSGLVKRYVTEAGSAWVTYLLDPTTGAELYAASITEVEVVSALVRRSKTMAAAGVVPPVSVFAAIREFSLTFDAVELTPNVIARAVAVAQSHSLRAYDAVQPASALELSDTRTANGATPVTLVSADSDLNTAAVAEGLNVEDPNAYP